MTIDCCDSMSVVSRRMKIGVCHGKENLLKAYAGTIESAVAITTVPTAMIRVLRSCVPMSSVVHALQNASNEGSEGSARGEVTASDCVLSAVLITRKSG